MKKTLVGVYGQDWSKRALAKAIKIGKKFEAEITFVSVFHPAPTSSTYESSHKALENAKDSLEHERAKYKFVSTAGANPPKAIMGVMKEKSLI